MNLKASISYMIVLLLVIAIAWGFAYKLHHSQSQVKRLTDNITTMQRDIEYFDSENGFLIARTQVLEFRRNELEKTNQGLEIELKELRVKQKRLETYSKTGIESTYSLSVPIQRSPRGDSTTFSYHNQWIDVQGVADSTTQQLRIHSIDTLVQVVYRGKRRRPYLWVFSPRILEQVIYSKNPNTQIVYNKTIQIVRK